MSFAAASQRAVDVAASIEDAVDDDRGRIDVKGDRDAPFKTRNVQSWPNIVPLGAAFGRIL
jgi:hypothetical protein